MISVSHVRQHVREIINSVKLSYNCLKDNDYLETGYIKAEGRDVPGKL